MHRPHRTFTHPVRTGSAARILHRIAHAVGGAALGALLFACNGDDVTSARTSSNAHSLRLSIAPTIVAGPGAVVEAIVSYTPKRGGAVVTLAHDSIVIANTLTSANASLSLSVNVAPCVDDATAAGATCSVTLTLRLKRDGVLLDENIQQFDVNSATQALAVPATNLYEVSAINITPSTLANIETGDTRTLVATAVDRSGAAVATRTVTWSVVSGNVTVSTAGVVTVVGTGPAVVRATIGGRTQDLSFGVGQPTVGTITLAPVDTLIAVGGAVTLRSAFASSNGIAVTGRTPTYTSSNPAVATVSALGVVTGVSVGATTITATSTEGRGGTTVTASVPLRVEAAPPILVDRAAVSLDSLVPNTTSTAATVAITTAAGKRIAGLRATVAYSPNVTPWLTATISPLATPATLTLQASSGALAPGNYTADVVISSSTDPNVPATVRVTFTVLAARRVTVLPKTIDFGTIGSAQIPTGVTVTVGSATSAVLNGLAAKIEYIGSASGWLTAVLASQTAAPTTTLLITPRPAALADGAYQARVIVSSTTAGAGPDTVAIQLSVAPAGKFTGLVQSAVTKLPIAGATVTTRRLTDNAVVDVATTGTDGRFTSAALTSGHYSVSVAATGFISSNLVDAQLTGDATVPLNTLATTLLAPVGSGGGVISGTVRDATTNAVLTGATVELRAGANNTTGTALATTTSGGGASGTYAFAAQPAGTYTIRATQTGYAASSVTVTVSGSAVTAPVLFISPGGANAVWRFVLSWGTTPTDLDAHLTGPIVGSTARFHVYFGTPGSATTSPFARLDVDQVNGNGPETITISQQNPGVYRYFVNNYSQESPLSTSNARVDVYQGNTLVNQFFVPAGTGTYWTVFEINGTILTPINTIGTAQPAIVAGSALRVSPADSPATRAAAEWFNLFPDMLTKPSAVKRP